MNHIRRQTRKSEIIAWDIFGKIIAESGSEYIPCLTHPGDEQYKCLTVVNRCGHPDSEALIFIDLYGTGIRVVNEQLTYKDKMSQNQIKTLVSDILDKANILKAKEEITLPGIKFILDLMTMDKNAELSTGNSWFDGSHDSCLAIEAKSFQYYPVPHEQGRLSHIPWWTISFGNITLAICNFQTNMVIDQTGQTYDLLTGDQEPLRAIEALLQKEIFYKVIDETRELLRQNDEWQKRYTHYAEDIFCKLDFILSVRKKFREWSPLKVYLNVSNAKQTSNSIQFDLRYLGQTVADLKFNKVFTIDTKKYDDHNEPDFGCEIKLNKSAWDGSYAKQFRDYFRKLYASPVIKTNKGNEEHRIESLLLSEFLNQKQKVMRLIKPVTISNLRYPMPTPLTASNHKRIGYSGSNGGGIDILARTGTGGRATNLCILELKDENTKKEPPKDAIKQAIAYSTFIRELLRSNSGEIWWKLFGFGGRIPKKLVLFAACAMPSNENNDYSFGGMELNIDGDIIKLQYIFFAEENDKITSIETSLKTQAESKNREI